MAKFYRTSDIRELVENKIDEAGKIIIRDKESTPDQINRWISEIRIFQKYCYELLEEMDEVDRLDDIEMAKWREQQKAKAGESSDP